MKEKYYKEKLKSLAREASAPDVLDEIKRADFSLAQESGQGVIPEPAPQKKPLSRRRLFKWTASLAAVTAFIFIFAFVILPQLVVFDSTVYATASVSISGTTSYSVEINKNSKVIDITAENKTGDAVLQNLSYKQKNFDNVLTALLKACVDYWDLTEAQLSNDKITFSVSCHDNDKKTSLESCWNSSMSSAKQHCGSNSGHNSGHH